jgi:hypothetical protein
MVHAFFKLLDAGTATKGRLALIMKADNFDNRVPALFALIHTEDALYATILGYQETESPFQLSEEDEDRRTCSTNVFSREPRKSHKAV